MAIFTAIDTSDFATAKKLVTELNGDSNFKFGLEFLLAQGPQKLSELNIDGKKLFLDYKLIDIEDTVTKAALAAVTQFKPALITVSIWCGRAAISRLVKKIAQVSPNTKVLTTHILTATPMADIQELLRLSNPIDLGMQAAHYSLIGSSAGAHGTVCGGHHLKALRTCHGPDYILLTPAIRPKGTKKNGQKRTVTPKKAILNGADHIVVGRPITQHKMPLKAYQAIKEEVLRARTAKLCNLK